MATGSTYIYPVESFSLTQDFGENPTYYAKYGQKGHNGLDLGVPLRTPVRASRDGIVKFAGNGAALYYVGAIAGNYVLLDHGDMWTGYAHSNSLNVKIGQKVKQGDVIAYAGKTGDASGVHVHFEFIPPANPVTNKNGYWGRENPNDYLEGEDMLTEQTLTQLWAGYADQYPAPQSYLEYWTGRSDVNACLDWLINQDIHKEIITKSRDYNRVVDTAEDRLKAIGILEKELAEAQASGKFELITEPVYKESKK